MEELTGSLRGMSPKRRYTTGGALQFSRDTCPGFLELRILGSLIGTGPVPLAATAVWANNANLQ